MEAPVKVWGCTATLAQKLHLCGLLHSARSLPHPASAAKAVPVLQGQPLQGHS